MTYRQIFPLHIPKDIICSSLLKASCWKNNYTYPKLLNKLQRAGLMHGSFAEILTIKYQYLTMTLPSVSILGHIDGQLGWITSSYFTFELIFNYQKTYSSTQSSYWSIYFMQGVVSNIRNSVNYQAPEGLKQPRFQNTGNSLYLYLKMH
jgi:hypothetical protein